LRLSDLAFKSNTMIQLKINNLDITVQAGTTILNAAKSLGIEIPTMCYLQGNGNHPSCMVCVVKDKRNGNLLPSCAMLAEQGMEIVTGDEEVRNARRDALELLLSDHVGDCEAPCRTACPAFMNIPLMNRLIADGKFDEAIRVVKEDIALPFILGYICSAPCEKVCRRKQADDAVSICMLKRFVAQHNMRAQASYLPEKKTGIGKRVAIVGAGLAGMSCAFYLLRNGYDCTIFESKSQAGGTLLDIREEVLPREALSQEVDLIARYGAKFVFDTTITPAMLSDRLLRDYDFVVFASGPMAKSSIPEFGFTTGKLGVEPISNYRIADRIFACGSIIQPLKMAVKAVAQGKEAALALDDYVKGISTRLSPEVFNSRFGLLLPEEVKEYLRESIPGGRIAPAAGHLAGFSTNEAIAEAKRCMHCDCRKPDTCKLRQYSDEYGVDRKRYAFGERKIIRKYLQHNMVVYEPRKCIKCGLCIEITSKNKELVGLSYIGRGFDVTVDIPFRKTLDEAITGTAKECVEACPTGALSFKF